MTLPPAYRLLERGRVRAVVLEELAGVLDDWLLAPVLQIPTDATPLTGGRGAAWRITLPGGVRAVLRENRRGGLVRHFVARHYLGVRPRPFAELAVTAEARRRGVPAPEVLAARVDGRLVYRGALVTREIPGALPLLAALSRADGPGARDALAASAGRTVACLHDAGVFHADLNLGNILVSDHETTVVDFDRARLNSGPLDAAARRQNLRRLGRSLRKLDPDGQVAGPEAVAAFRRAYGAAIGDAWGDACGC